MRWLRRARERRKARELWRRQWQEEAEKARERRRRQWQEEAERLAAYTPSEVAERLAAHAPSEIAKRLGYTKLSRLPTGDTGKLARDIAELNDDDRYLLALVAEGRTRRYISRHLYEAETTVKQDLNRIAEHLGGTGAGTA